MVRDFRPTWFAVPGAALQDLRQPGVGAQPVVLGNRVVHELSNQEMNEAVTLRCDLHENRSVGALLATLDVVPRVVFVAGFEQADVELSSDDGPTPKGAHTGWCHRGESLLNGGANRTGDRGPRRGSLPAPQLGYLGKETWQDDEWDSDYWESDE